MENTTHCNSQTAEEQIKSFIDFVDALPMFSPVFREELKILFAELMPSVRERNRERIHTLIDSKRDVGMNQVDLDTSVSSSVRIHRKDGIKIKADILKWLLDEMLFVSQS